MHIGVKQCLGSVHTRKAIDETCVYRRGVDAIRQPELIKILEGSLFSHSVISSMNVQHGRGVGLSIDTRGVDGVS